MSDKLAKLEAARKAAAARAKMYRAPAREARSTERGIREQLHAASGPNRDHLLHALGIDLRKDGAIRRAQDWTQLEHDAAEKKLREQRRLVHAEHSVGHS